MIREIFASVVGVFAFAVLFHAPRKSYFACALLGGVSWGGYLLFSALGAGEFLAAALAIVVLTICARVCAVLLEMPATVFIVSGIFPIVPGAGIYYTAYSLMAGDMALFQDKATETVAFAGAIALGIIVGMGLPQAIPGWIGGFLRKCIKRTASE